MGFSQPRQSSSAGISALISLKPVGYRSDMGQPQLSGGTLMGQTFRVGHFTGPRSAYGLRLVYSGRQLKGGGETNLANPFFVKVALEYVGGSIPVLFSGAATATVNPGVDVLSDPIPVRIPANTLFWIRTYFSVGTLGEKWPLGRNTIAAIGESYTAGASDSAYATGALPTTASTLGGGPTAVLGLLAGPPIGTAGIIGSSSGYGQGDNPAAPFYDPGYLSLALSGAGVPNVRMAAASDTLLLANTKHQGRQDMLFRAAPAWVINQLGGNDVTNGASLATAQSRLSAWWDFLDGCGCKIIQATYTPLSTSTDNWATLANQTTNVADDVRQQLNAWVRTKPHAAIADVWDIAPLVEDAGGKFKADGTAFKWTVDGTHLSPFAHSVVAAALANKATALLSP